MAAAQSREAPVQRLADAVAGRFCYGVMAASALTFAFWQTLGIQFPLLLVLLLLLPLLLLLDALHNTQAHPFHPTALPLFPPARCISVPWRTCCKRQCITAAAVCEAGC